MKIELEINRCTDVSPPLWTPVLVEGGVARWTGRYWLTLMDGTERAIGWPVRWWCPLLHEKDFKVTEDATDTPHICLSRDMTGKCFECGKVSG